MHLDLDNAVAVTGFAPPALDIEGEPGRIVAAHLGVIGLSEHLPDVGEYAGVGRRVGTGGPSDGGLVDVDDLVQLLYAQNIPVLAGTGLGTVELGRQRLVEDLVDERALARAGYAGDHIEAAQRNLDIHILEVVFPGAPDGEELAVSGTALGRHFDLLCA